MNQFGHVIADIIPAHLMTLAQVADRLKEIKRKNDNYSSVGVSASSLSRIQKRDQFTFYRNRIWSELMEGLVRELGILNSEETFQSYLDHLACDDEVLSRANFLYARRYKPRLSLAEERNWSSVEHLFGAWQTVNFSTFFDERPEDNETLHLRSGVRFIGKHNVMDTGRLRMKVVDLGNTTIWEGSADVHEGYIYIRMREESGSLESGRPHQGERMYNIYGDPGTFHEVTRKRNREYLTKGVVQVVVRASQNAGLDDHLFYGVSVMRLLPQLSETYAEFNNGLSLSDVDTLPVSVHEQYCFRRPVEEIESAVASGSLVGEQYHKLDKIVRWMKEPQSLKSLSMSTGCFIFELGATLDLS